MKIKMLLFFIVGSTFVLTQLSFAEEPRKETVKIYKLGEVVVTATRTERPITEAPGSVSVVTKEDIEKRNIQTVDQALNTLPGVFHRRKKGLMDTLADVILRGIPGVYRTLIMMDGITLHDAYSGGVRFGGMVPEDIERIEVVRGPFSSLYGGYAMGGVVNIITKMPVKREFTIKSGYGTSWERGEAMDDLKKFYLSYGDKFREKLSLFLSYGYKTTNGYPTDLNVVGIQPPAGITGWTYTTDYEGNPRFLIGDRGDNRWWDDNITLKAGYEFSETSKVNLSFLRTRYEYNYDEPHTYLRNAAGNPVWSYTVGGTTVRESTFLAGYGGVERNVYNLNYETEISTIKTKLSLSLVDCDKNWYTSPGILATRVGGPGRISSTPSEGYNADLQFTLPLFERHIITFGGSFRHNWANTKEHRLTNWKNKESKTDLIYQSKGKDRTYALFVQDEIMILDNLTAYIGFRQDWWKTYDGYVNQVGTAGYPKTYDPRDKSSFSPKAAIVYKPFKKTALRTSIGRAFRPPTIYELYRTWTWINKTYASNPDLEPETTTSWDIGVEQGLWKGAKIKATYFENYLEDLIYRRMVTPTYLDLVNVGKAESKGIELEVEQSFGRGMRLFTNFTYNYAKVKENPAKPETEGKRLTMVPERIFNIGAELDRGPFSLSLTGRYVSKVYSTDENKDKVNNVYKSYDPYFIADARISYKITKFATLSFSVDNIFDRDYFYYCKAPGRSWFCEITMRF